MSVVENLDDSFLDGQGIESSLRWEVLVLRV